MMEGGYKSNKYDLVKNVVANSWDVQIATPLDYSFKELIEVSGGFKSNKYDRVKSVVANSWDVQIATPLDYSFKELIEVSELLDEEPRIGKIDNIEQNKKLKNKENKDDEELDNDSETGEKESKESKDNQTGWNKKILSKAPLIIPMVPISSSHKYHQKNGVTVFEDTEKKRVKYVNRALRLSYNNFLSLEGLDAISEKIIADPFKNLSWIDLSFNSLENIHECIVKFENLKTLFLHANKISNLAEIDKLAKLPNIRSLTLHGNPLEEEKNYRLYVVLMIPQLVNLNFSGISKQEKIGSKGCIGVNPHKNKKKKSSY